MSSAIRKDRIGLYNTKTNEIYDITLEQYEREQKAQKAVNAYKWSSHKDKFVFARMEAIHEIIDALTTQQCGMFLVLQSFADYDGILRNTAWLKKNKSVMTNKDIIEELRVPKQTFTDFINRCLDNEIIIKSDDSYKLNSKYHFRGEKKQGDMVTKIYNTEVRNMKGKVSYADMGLLYCLIPHINFVTNTICTNPFETDPRLIKKLNKKEICDLLDISHHTFNRLLDMEYDGKVVFAEVRIKRKYKSYLVNPWVFYRLKAAPNDSLVGEEIDTYQPDKTLVSIFSRTGDE